jgi:hypothetical protein
MLEKSALADEGGEGGECTPTPSHSSYHYVPYKVAVYALAPKADTLPLFHLYPYMYSMDETNISFTVCRAKFLC